jgi:hypothetical protein
MTTFWVSFLHVDGCLGVDIVDADDKAAPENR